MPHTITLLVSGTLGDVLPFVALGCGLREEGLRVRIATHAPFAPHVLARGLEYAALGKNPSDLLGAEPRALTLAGGPLGAALASWRYVRAARPRYAGMLRAAHAASRGSDALVVALPTLWGLDVAEALGARPVLAPLQPLGRTAAWPSALLPLRRSYGPGLNRLSHRLLELALWLPWRAVIDEWRAEVGLPPARQGSLARADAAGTPCVYGFSPWLAPPPRDWPTHHVVAGAWRIPPDEPPPAELARFLAGGPPPIYVGFGSMGARQPAEDAALILEAAALAGRRVVLLGGPDARRAARGRRDVLVVAHAPHDWLLPQVAAAVHHGGAGTTHAGLRAGVPTATVPVAADQYFWGERVRALRAGPAPVPRRALTAARLAALIAEASETPGYRRQAAALGALLGQEQGVARAAAIIAAVVRRV